MPTTDKLFNEIRQLNRKVDKLNGFADKLRISISIQDYKAYMQRKEIVEMGRVVNQLNCKVKKINHEICDPNNDPEKIRSKILKFNERIEQLSSEIDNKLRTLRDIKTI